MRSFTGTYVTLIVLGVGLTFRAAQNSYGVDLYFNDFEADTVGPVTRPSDSFLYEFHGDTGVTLAEEVTAAGGVGGTKSYQQTIGAAGAPYFYSGFGQFAVDFSNMPTGPDADNPAMYRFSGNVKVSGNTGNSPVQFNFVAIDPDYEAEHAIDVNADGDLLDGASVYERLFSPTIVTPGVNTPFSFTLAEGTAAPIDADVRPEDRFFNSSQSLLWQASFNNGTFGLDAGNIVSVDDIKIEFLGEVSAGLLGDYNGNNIIDAADYTVWRNAFENGGTLLNEAETPDVVDQADYDYWKDHFGETPSGAASASSVPEPATGCMAIAGLLGLAAVVGGRTRRSAG